MRALCVDSGCLFPVYFATSCVFLCATAVLVRIAARSIKADGRDTD